ncbi:hypothetical protein AVEN_87459-1 [Araneus ventricosus]|uniref:Uncharacterized protein n=1 Tax=Araneus ventricosus TaxID=182803 RepID=A0A4Y2SI73_ARAVE|nr:hypothetical protein AVEN_87459-1 [Araneus ventricosus]
MGMIHRPLQKSQTELTDLKVESVLTKTLQPFGLSRPWVMEWNGYRIIGGLVGEVSARKRGFQVPNYGFQLECSHGGLACALEPEGWSRLCQDSTSHWVGSTHPGIYGR